MHIYNPVRAYMYICIKLKLIQIKFFCVSAEITTSVPEYLSVNTRAAHTKLKPPIKDARRCSPPPTAPGATPATLAVSSIQTRSAGQRSIE